MTIPAFRQNLFAGLSAAAPAVPRKVSVAAPTAVAQPSARQSSAPVKSTATIEAEHHAAERARIAAAVEQQRQAQVAAAEEKARRKEASDAVWAKAWAPREGLPGMNGRRDEASRKANGSVWAKARAANEGLAGSNARSGTDQDNSSTAASTIKRQKSDDVWARAYAKNQALRAHLDGGNR
ncbi:hypothetical protein [Sphingobium fuliginis]|uniref:Uncharacterized protein n=1 Tax=Sphingobium fuliginis (strain ATCC 27551) TaxID=336203 RepID=A0ABQ1ETQ6_SPHSA|nr:hypothetical protein [Sphingobium fuliginis]RYL99492.1 hypothetical protein EWH10_06355 [Sphingobium fuliginis]GFZ85136.1 hypothetical protein GCM10019071_12690 [Sphingobium fuliginis]